jgi:aryl-alcohol dehydrogenase-like predicted oxidoreductase
VNDRPNMDRIVLGTVQLGLPYGRRAGAGLMREVEAFAVLDAAWNAGIRDFDTAEAYGCAAERLSRWVADRGTAPEARIVTKVVATGEPGLEERAEAALARFAGVGHRLILTHGAARGEAWEAVHAAACRASSGAGQSVYDPEEVAAAVAQAGVSRVQAPANVFDDRVLEARGSSAVPLDLRSIYLQGVLTEEPAAAEARVAGGGALSAAVKRAADAVDAEPAVLLCAAMLARVAESADRLVIGVDAPSQIADLMRAVHVDAEVVAEFERLVVSSVEEPIQPRVLDPRRW